MKLPPGVALVVETVKVAVSDPVMEVGLTVAVTPAGAPIMAGGFNRFTVPVKPLAAVMEMVAVRGGPPGVRFRVAGDDDSVKNGLVAEVGARAAIVPGPFGVPQPVARS